RRRVTFGGAAEGLAVEAVQGAQAQVGGLVRGGGVAQHLGVVLLEEGAAHGDVVVDHHRSEGRGGGILPPLEQVDVEGEPGRGQLQQGGAQQRAQRRDQRHAERGGGDGAAVARGRPRLRPTV